MKLTYRGTSYNYEPPTLDMMPGELEGKYRGNKWQMRYPRHIPVPQPVEQLKYRGVSYVIGEPALTPEPATAPPVTVVAGRSLQDEETLVKEVAQIHRNNICRSLERRLQAAKIQGDDNLVELLEQESERLTCSLD